MMCRPGLTPGRPGNRWPVTGWRMALAHQWLTTLAAHPPQRPARYQIAVAFGLALLAQAVVDQDDEAALQAAPNEIFRQATLLNILDSTRPNVLPDVVSQVVQLGPGVVPHLIEILEDDNIWGWLRALPVIEQIARAHPGAADTAVPAILDLVYDNQSDEILDAVAAALIAIGPGAVNGICLRSTEYFTNYRRSEKEFGTEQRNSDNFEKVKNRLNFNDPTAKSLKR